VIPAQQQQQQQSEPQQSQSGQQQQQQQPGDSQQQQLLSLDAVDHQLLLNQEKQLQLQLHLAKIEQQLLERRRTALIKEHGPNTSQQQRQDAISGQNGINRSSGFTNPVIDLCH
jgi:hypothetical protein